MTGWPGLPVTTAVQPAPLGLEVSAGQHVGTLTATTPLGATSTALTADASCPPPPGGGG